MKAPGFWFADTPGARLAGRLLAPLEPVTASLTARRLRRPGWAAPVPVVCCGNAGVGGAGKTTLVLDLAARLLARGIGVHCLTRGYGGRTRRTPLRVDPARHDAGEVGDEALLLAALAPCWVGADRAASARAAVAAGAELLLMDDGMQNPGLRQDLAILVVDGAVGFGNNRLLPAGPLREPVACAAARAGCVVVIGEQRLPIEPLLPGWQPGPDLAPGRGPYPGTHHGSRPDPRPGRLPVLRATLAMDASVRALAGRTLFAFAGIARPEKFFRSLADEGLLLAGTRGFADHRRFGGAALRRLRGDAAALGATLVTTAKDAARLSPQERDGILVAGVSLRWADDTALQALLDRIVAS